MLQSHLLGFQVLLIAQSNILLKDTIALLKTYHYSNSRQVWQSCYSQVKGASWYLPVCKACRLLQNRHCVTSTAEGVWCKLVAQIQWWRSTQALPEMPVTCLGVWHDIVRNECLLRHVSSNTNASSVASHAHSCMVLICHTQILSQ